MQIRGHSEVTHRVTPGPAGRSGGPAPAEDGTPRGAPLNLMHDSFARVVMESRRAEAEQRRTGVRLARARRLDRRAARAAVRAQRLSRQANRAERRACVARARVT
jgi:hypothetical protein